jgi:hypothetical protein
MGSIKIKSLESVTAMVRLNRGRVGTMIMWFAGLR